MKSLAEELLQNVLGLVRELRCGVDVGLVEEVRLVGIAEDLIQSGEVRGSSSLQVIDIFPVSVSKVN